MSLVELPVSTLGGETTTLGDLGDTLLVVNVASRCGLTPQYEGLEAMHERYHDRGFAVVGFPCNQFGEQEPGSADEIQTFCSTTYGVTFPLMAKIEVNGEDQSPLYRELNEVVDADGYSGAIRWNFEKFLVRGSGEVTRFAPGVTPEDPSLVSAVEAALQ